MNGSKISYEQVLAMADQLKRSSQEVESILSNVSSLLSRVGDVWSGQTASEAIAKFEQLSRKLPEFSNAIASCQTYLTSVVENYKNVDQTLING